MGSIKHDHKILSVGFEGLILRALKDKFNITFSIARDSEADLNWDDLHLLKVQESNIQLSEEILVCLSHISEEYLNYCNINSRRFQYINGRDSETYNAFILTFYEIYRILTEYEIDLVLHSNVPHEGFDYLIYLISKNLGIKSVICHQSLIPNRFWLCASIENFGLHSLNPNINLRKSSEYELPKDWFYMKGINKVYAYSVKNALMEIVQRPYRF